MVKSIPFCGHVKKLVPQGAVASKALLPSARRERLNQTTLETDHYAVRVPLPDLDPPIKSSNPGGRITIEKIADVTCSDNQVSSSLNCQHLVPSEHIAARYSAKNFQQPSQINPVVDQAILLRGVPIARASATGQTFWLLPGCWLIVYGNGTNLNSGRFEAERRH